MEDLKSFDPQISDEVFNLFSNLIYRTSGIRLNKSKKVLLVSRLSKRLRRCGVRSFYEYYRVVKNNDEELTELLNCISTNTTRFFREVYHFRYLEDVVFPELLNGNKKTDEIRIWSAGCSTGEEPYSIAITIKEFLRRFGSDHAVPEIKILATDISTRALNIARAGIYEREQSSRRPGEEVFPERN